MPRSKEDVIAETVAAAKRLNELEKELFQDHKHTCANYPQHPAGIKVIIQDANPVAESE